ncbi:hypothetical protein AK812_SmicGene12234 [Symbiodinium microadriaticum]|uniref:Sulfotransferase domain-containing protein n=1 Tax=Symbiodinium microadriaticum TaxID=2951 RepID=A0A1Q9EB67_SYMMI|nr:hypothetical protein AK812_SmicGene12234 [Symbiodinium microadriaticum]
MKRAACLAAVAMVISLCLLYVARPNALLLSALPKKPLDRCSGPKLILHVGPYKTGTTALQSYLRAHGDWLQDAMGITVPFPTGVRKWALELSDLVRAKLDPSRVPGTKFNETKLQKWIMFFKNTMKGSSEVIVSSEKFALFNETDWGYLLSLLHPGVDKACISVVVAHRDPEAWMTSRWLQQNKHKTNPQSWASKLTEILSSRVPNSFGFAGEQLYILDVLNAVFPGALDAVSYDYLREANCSLAAFVICNSTLRRKGPAWRECKKAIEARSVKEETNTSPPPAAVEVTILARSLYEAKQAQGQRCNWTWPRNLFTKNNTSREAVTAHMFEVMEVAEHMPVTCAAMGDIFKAEVDEWFARTGALRPTSSYRKPICHIDERQLEVRHWRRIDKLLHGC